MLTLENDTSPVELSDMDLVELTRAGDKDAFGVLWSRHYSAAIRAARTITQKHDPEDIAQEAFTRIFMAIQSDRGPKDVFRAYLYSVLRSVSINWASNEIYEASLDELPVNEDTSYSFEGQVIAGTIMAQAFTTLKSEWRAVLWYLDVEGMTPKEAAPILGLSANSTSALAYRAREALRSAWLQSHVNSDRAAPACKWAVERLGAYNRGSLPPRQKSKLQEHLTYCLKCSILVEEVDDLSRNLGIFLLPALMGPQAFSYLKGLNSVNAVRGTQNPEHTGSARHAHAALGKTNLVLLGSAVVVSGIIAAGIFMSTANPPTTPQAASIPKSVETRKDAENTVTPATAEPSAITTTTQTAAPESVALILGRTVTSELAQLDPHRPRPVAFESTSEQFVVPAAASPSPSPSYDPTPTEATSHPAEPTHAAPSPTPTLTPTPTPTPPVIPQPSVPPEAPVALAAPVVVSAVSQGLFLPVLNGRGTPGATVTILLGAAEVGEGLVNSQGLWTVSPELVLTSSQSVIFTTYQSLDGLVSILSEPTAPLQLGTPDFLSIRYADGAGDLTFSGPEGSTVEVLLDGVATGNIHTMDGNPVVRRLPALTIGTHTLMLRFIDTTQPRHGASLYREFTVG